MFKKIFAFLLIPTMAIGVFLGCGKKHTLIDIKNYYDNMVVKYSYAVEGEQNVERRSYIFAQRSSDGKVPGTAMYITYKGDLSNIKNVTSDYDIEGNGFLQNDDDLYNRYYALVNIEQKLLDWIYRYYTNWSENLYASNDLTKYDFKQKDIEDLYKKLKKLDSVIADFVTEKTKTEEEINAITFEGAINLTSFTYAFNDLIEASFDFVNTFRDVHTKYIWNSYVFGSDEDTNKLLLNKLIDETYLNMAQVIYLENVKAFEYSECDLAKLVDLIQNNNVTEINDWLCADLLYKKNGLNNAGYQKGVYKSNGDYYTADDVELKLVSTDGQGNDVYETYNDKLEQFIYYLKAFNQKIDIYKKVYSDLNFYKYNQVRLGFGTTDVQTYKVSLDRVDSANLSLIENFTSVTFEYYVNNFIAIFE